MKPKKGHDFWVAGLCVICILMHWHVQAKPEPISPTFGIGSLTYALDVSSDRQWLLYSSATSMNSAENPSEGADKGDIFLVDRDHEDITPLSVDIQLDENEVFDAVFSSNDTQVLLMKKRYNDNNQLIIVALYAHDIASGETNQVNNLPENIVVFEPAQHGQIFYLHTPLYAFELFIYDTLNRTFEAIELADFMGSCLGDVKTGSNTNNLLLRGRCGKQLYLYSPEHDWRDLGRYDSYSESVVLTGDGQHLAFYNSHDQIEVWDIADNDIVKTLYSFDRSLIQKKSHHDLLLVNDDASIVVFKEVLDSSVYDVENLPSLTNPHLLAYHLEKQQTTFLTFTHQSHGSRHVIHENVDGNYLTYLQSESDLGLTLYGVSLTEQLFQLEQVFDSTIEVGSHMPLSAQVNITNSAPYGLLKRTNQYTRESDFLIIKDDVVAEQTHDFHAQVYRFEYYACNTAFACSETPTSESTIQIIDFSSTPQLTLSYIDEDDGDLQPGRLEVIPSWLDGIDFVNLKALGKFDQRLYQDQSHVHDVSSDLQYVAQYCIADHRKRSCGGFSKPLSVMVPKDKRPLSVKILPDLSGVRIESHAQSATRFRVFRQIEQEFSLIYDGSDSVFIDTDNLLGKNVQYIVFNCNELSCAKSESEPLFMGRQKPPIAFYTYASHSDFIHNKLTINTDYYFESFQIERINFDTLERALVVEIPGYQSEYFDLRETFSDSWYYVVRGCYQGRCLFEARDDTSRVTFKQSLVLPLAPENLSFDKSKWLLTGELSWDAVSGVDGYRIRVNGATGVTRSYFIEGENNTTLVIPYKEYSGQYIDIEVQSYVFGNGGSSSRIFSDKGAELRTLAFNQNEITSLYRPEFKYIQWVSNNKNSVAFDFDVPNAFDRYFLHWRKDHEENYTIQPLESGTLANSRYSYRFTETFEVPTTYHYKIEGCNDYLENCVFFQNEAAVTFHPILDFAAETLAPMVEWDGAQNVTVTPLQTGNFDFNWVEIEVSDYSGWSFHSTRSIYRGEIVDNVPFALWELPENDTLYFRTRFCLTPLDYVSFLQDYCSAYGDITELQFPEEFERTSPPIQHHIAYQLFARTTNDNVHEVIVQGASWQAYQDLADINAPTYIRIWRGIGLQPMTMLTDVDFASYVNSEDDIIYIDDQINVGESARYQLQFCNAYGCSRMSDVKGIAVADTGWTPITPEVSQYHAADKQSVKVTLPQMAKQINLRWGLSQNTYSTTHQWSLSEFLAVDGIKQVQLNQYDSVWVSAQACNEQFCSGWSEPFEVQQRDRLNNDIQLNNELWQRVGSRFDDDIAWRTRSLLDIASRYGEPDTIIGELNYEDWFYLEPEATFTSRVYLTPDQSHECHTLFRQGINLGDEFAQDLVRILYTGNGCSSYPELELFQYYLLSDFSSEPQLLADPDDYLRQWVDIRLGFNEHSQIQVDIEGETVFTSESVPQFEVFALTKLYWQTTKESALASVGAVSGQVPPYLTASLSPWIDFSEIEVIHPTAFAFIDRYDITDVFSVNVQQLVGAQFKVVEQMSFTGVDRVTPQFVDGQRPGSSAVFAFSRCESQRCGPYYAKKLTFPEYGSLKRWTSISRPRQAFANELLIRLHEGDGYAETISLHKKSRSDGAYIELLPESYVDVVERGGSWQSTSFLSQLLFTAEDLDPTSRYQFRFEVCNPIGCVLTQPSNYFDVPVDSDADGVVDENDPFPNDPTEWLDSDNDGIGNNEDIDDDGDGIPDIVEISLGLNPTSSNDATLDADDDGYNNLLEFMIGSDVKDSNSTPADFGTFISFEEDERYDVSIAGAHHYVDYTVLHGERRIRSYAGATSLTITVNETVGAGTLLFGLRSEPKQMAITLDGEPLTASRGTDTRNHWIMYQVETSVSGKQLIFEFEFRAWQAFSMDALYLPGHYSQYTQSDFNGDGYADLAIRDTSRFVNYVKELNSDDVTRFTFGKHPNDISVEGDFDGDGITDVAVRRASNKTWYILRSSDGEIERHQFGLQESDIPVPADYDGDGITDIAVRRPSTFMWYIKRSSDEEIERVQFGKHIADIPVPADYDGDGKADIAVRRPSNTIWYVLRSSDGEIERHLFGKRTEDIAVPADYDGDGRADLAVRRPSSQMWYIRQSSDDTIVRHHFGRQAKDIPVIADYDGDGKADIAVRRASNHHWYILNSSDDSITRAIFGKNAAYVPLLAPIQLRMAMIAGESDFIPNSVSSDWSEAANDQAFFNEQVNYTKEVMINE